MIENKTTLQDCKQLEVLCDQSRSSESSQLPNYNGRVNLTTRSKLQNQPVTSPTTAECHQDDSANVDPSAYTTVTEHECEDSTYTVIDITR
jgi:hypothetical protein